MKSENNQVIRVIRSRKIKVILEMIFTLFSLIFGLTYAVNAMLPIEEEMAVLLGCTLFFMGLSRLFRALGMRYRKPTKARKWVDFITAAVFILWLVPMIIKGQDPWTHEIACILFLLSLVAVWVLSVVQDHSLFNIAKNVILAALVAFLTIDLWDPQSVDIGWSSTMGVAVGVMMINIMSVAFARIQLSMLRDIVRKTYAAEIIGGLVLLIFTFSYVLTFMEESMGSYRNALWYCFALVTTIGFGDFTAVSGMGRIISVILGIYGIIVVALITSIIVNFYGEVKKSSSEKKSQESESTEEDDKDT